MGSVAVMVDADADVTVNPTPPNVTVGGTQAAWHRLEPTILMSNGTPEAE
jgi:hypothetical protein